MKKLLIIILLIFIAVSCDNIPSDVVDSSNPNFDVVSIDAPSSLVLSTSSVQLVTSVKLSSPQNVDKVTTRILSIDGRYSIGSTSELKDDGNSPDQTANDLIYTTSYTLDEQIPSDNYLIEYYVTSLGDQRKVAVKNFSYDNGTENMQPVLSDIIAPDSLVVADTVAFAVSVQVSDENGLNDIKNVYFFVTRPDGVSSGSPTFLFDDGDFQANGDETANDGRYSRIIKINEANQKGTYKLEFQAEDKGNKKSEILTHNFLVK